jgi:hypothetical protein
MSELGLELIIWSGSSIAEEVRLRGWPTCPTVYSYLFRIDWQSCLTRMKSIEPPEAEINDPLPSNY